MNDSDPFSPTNRGYSYVAYVVGSFDIIIFFHTLIQLGRIFYYEHEANKKESNITNVSTFFKIDLTNVECNRDECS